MKKVLLKIAIFWICSISVNALEDHSTPAQHKKIQDILNSVHTDLKNNQIALARNKLEETAGNFHSEEIELALVQTYMQGGEYRHALSSAAHTQAEHRDFPEATLVYAWLLAIGGQELQAKNLLIAAQKEYPNAMFRKMQQQIESGLLSSDAFGSYNMLLKPIEPINSHLSGKLLANGISLNGKSVVTSRSALGKNTEFLIRSGIGDITKAYLDQTKKDPHVAYLNIDSPKALLTQTKLVDKYPFSGSPVYCAHFKKRSQLNWPQLRVDILGRPIDGTTDLYSLNNANLEEGSGLYNLSGALIGVVVNDGTTTNKVQLLINASTSKTSKETATPRIAPDQMYEVTLANSVQIFSM